MKDEDAFEHPFSHALIAAPLFCYSKKRLFEELVAAVLPKLSPEESRADLLRELHAREAGSSTAFFEGIALPHVLVRHDSPTRTVLCVLNNPVSYNSVDADALRIDIAMAVFISASREHDESEKLLHHLTKVLSNKELLAALRQARNEFFKLTLMLNKLDAVYMNLLARERQSLRSQQFPAQKAGAAGTEIPPTPETLRSLPD